MEKRYTKLWSVCVKQKTKEILMLSTTQDREYESFRKVMSVLIFITLAFFCVLYACYGESYVMVFPATLVVMALFITCVNEYVYRRDTAARLSRHYKEANILVPCFLELAERQVCDVPELIRDLKAYKAERVNLKRNFISIAVNIIFTIACIEIIKALWPFFEEHQIEYAVIAGILFLSCLVLLAAINLTYDQIEGCFSYSRKRLESMISYLERFYYSNRRRVLSYSKG